MKRPRLPQSLAGRMGLLAAVSLSLVTIPVAAWVSPWMLLFVPGIAGLSVSLVALRGILKTEARKGAKNP